MENEDPNEDLVEIEVDGEMISLPKAEVSQLKDLAGWRKKLTHEAEQMSQTSRTLGSQKEALEADRAAFSRERAVALDEPARRTDAKVEAVEEAGITTADLPNPVDDPEAFNAALQGKLQQAADLGFKKAERELGKKVESTRRATESAQAVSTAAQGVFTQNQRTVDAYIARMKDAGTPLTGEQTRDLIAYMDTSLRLPKAGLAERDPASGKIRFTEKAVEAADRVVRFDYWQERATETGLKDGLKRAGSSGDLTRDMARNAPAKTAAPKEKADFALTLSPKAMESYVSGLPEAELDAVMLHIYREAGEEGATSILRSRSDD